VTHKTDAMTHKTDAMFAAFPVFIVYLIN